MNITKVLNKYFQDNKMDSNISVIREDGIVLYSDLSKKYHPESIGALAAGVWQAAHALNSTIDKNIKDIIDFRLSFDKSDEGVYIVGIKHKKSNYLLCSIYDSVTNPAKLKMSIRNLKIHLQNLISDYDMATTSNDYLFKNITDADMDKLFAGGTV